MAVYEYKCTTCGSFTLQLPIGTAPDRHRCPVCSTPAPRAYSPPMVGRGSSPLSRMWERAEKSWDEPEVVTRVPPSPGHRPIAGDRRPPATP